MSLTDRGDALRNPKIEALLLLAQADRNPNQSGISEPEHLRPAMQSEYSAGYRQVERHYIHKLKCCRVVTCLNIYAVTHTGWCTSTHKNV